MAERDGGVFRVPAAPGGARDTSIDALRGLCIISMIACHLAKRSRLDDVTHPVALFDGALGFVLLSGLLIGMVQRAAMDRRGPRTGYVKLLRRVRLVWIGHVVICAIALSVGAADLTRRRGLPAPGEEGGLLASAWRVATLQINPPYASVLSVYVVVMLASLPVLELLRRSRHLWAASLVGAVYVAAVVWPGWSTLPERDGVTGSWAYATWFTLFAVGVLAGWSWRQQRVQLAVRSRRSLVVVGCLVAGLLVVVDLLPATPLIARLVDKEVLGPLRLLMGIGVCFLAWRALTAVTTTRVGAAAVMPLTVLGRRSLDSYLILSTTVLVLPSLSRHDQATSTGVAVALACLGICWAWAMVRDGRARWSWVLRPAVGSGGP